VISPVPGTAFLFRATDGDKHLHVCLTEPFDAPHEIPQQILVVSVTTIYSIKGEDLTCQLNDGDHEFIKHPSYVAYSRARYITIAQLQKAENQRLASEQLSVSSAIYTKIRSGLFASPRTSKCYRNFLLAYEKAIKDAQNQANP
jgi:hypothetical protein